MRIKYFVFIILILLSFTIMIANPLSLLVSPVKVHHADSLVQVTLIREKPNVADTSDSEQRVDVKDTSLFKVPDFSDKKKMKDYLVGIWHECSHVGAGYCDLYIFFASGHYIHQYNQYMQEEASTEEIYKSEGIWQYKEGVVLYKEIFRYYSTYNNLNIFKGYKVSSDINWNVQKYKLSKVAHTTVDGEEQYTDMLCFNGDTFWRMSVDPLTYFEICDELKNPDEHLKLEGE